MRTSPLLNPRTWLLAALALGVALGALAEPAKAARAPIGRTYFTLAVGLESSYGITAQCFEFYEDKLCSLDGLICGSWKPTGKGRHEMELSFDLTTVSDGELLELEGLGVLKAKGPKSSVAGTGRVGPVDRARRENFSFAAREATRNECLALLEDSDPGGGDETVVGSGVLASEERDVRDFHGVLAAGVGRIEIRHGATESLRITTDDNILPILTSRVAGGILILGADAPFQNTHDVRFEITVRELDSLTLAGVLAVEIHDLDTDRFDVEIGGVSVVTVAGRADHQKVLIAGVSRYDARDLTSRTVSIDIAGPSSAVVRVSDTLTGTCAGGARLEYIGNPSVNVAVDLVSTLRRID